MSGFKGIIIDGKVYEAILKGLNNCSDCALYGRCSHGYARGCDAFGYESYYFRFSQSLTDKINEK